MEMYEYNTGYLEIIAGPMKSGKTSRLLQLYKQFKVCDIITMVINNSKDIVHSERQLSTHDKIMIPCIQANTLTELVDFTKDITNTQFIDAKVILINEAQFFDDIVDWVTIAVEKYNKRVYICGLNCDFQRKPFGNWLNLEAICDNVIYLHSWCGICKKKHALFSHRLSNETEQIVIGANNYIPLCRKCWMSLNP